ncbi:MAG: hypothetical protein GX854_09945 [Clostridiales bacterium]|nr:hypothetical protein [Clostridiales bacterium]
MLAMWVAGSGGKLGIYEFNISVQILEIILYSILFAILYWVFKSKNSGKSKEEVLQIFPDFIEGDSLKESRKNNLGSGAVSYE